jgi:hypothetical protein
MNRKLSPQKKIVGQTRGRYRAASSGEFYVQDAPAFGQPSNIRYLNRADLESMARELGVLEDGETVKPESGAVTMSVLAILQ